MKPTKAWMCSEHNGDYCIPCRVVYIREEDIKPRGCLKLIPVTILPTPYFNALRNVARTNEMLCEKLDKIFSNEMYEAIFTLAHSHGLSYKGQPECSKELKQAKDATAKLEKEEKK